MNKVIGLLIFSIVFAFGTSIVQTYRINQHAKKYDKFNLLSIFILAGFAFFVSAIQSKRIVRKIIHAVTEKVTKNVKGGQENQ